MYLGYNHSLKTKYPFSCMRHEHSQRCKSESTASAPVRRCPSDDPSARPSATVAPWGCSETLKSEQLRPRHHTQRISHHSIPRPPVHDPSDLAFFTEPGEVFHDTVDDVSFCCDDERLSTSSRRLALATGS